MVMETRAPGTTGMRVPAIGMGTLNTFDVSGAEAEEACGAILDQAYAVGATLFDSSPIYGEAERVLAAATGERRNVALVVDKLWTSDAAGSLPWFDDEAREHVARLVARLAASR